MTPVSGSDTLIGDVPARVGDDAGRAGVNAAVFDVEIADVSRGRCFRAQNVKRARVIDKIRFIANGAVRADGYLSIAFVARARGAIVSTAPETGIYPFIGCTAFRVDRLAFEEPNARLVTAGHTQRLRTADRSRAHRRGQGTSASSKPVTLPLRRRSGRPERATLCRCTACIPDAGAIFCHRRPPVARLVARGGAAASA